MYSISHYSVDVFGLILAPVITGLITSVIFLLFLFNIRPSIKISDKVCKRKFDKPPGYKYTIKVINKSFFSMYDVDLYLALVTQSNVGNGTNVIKRDIVLTSKHLSHIPCKRKSMKNAEYAFLVNTYEDLDKIWQGDQVKIVFELSARHSLSGFSRVFVKEYGDKDIHLAHGKFHYGDSLEIIS
jgi:hypothetical protein